MSYIQTEYINKCGMVGTDTEKEIGIGIRHRIFNISVGIGRHYFESKHCYTIYNDQISIPAKKIYHLYRLLQLNMHILV